MSAGASTPASRRVRAAAMHLDQDFQTLRSKCLKSGQLFSDPAFPAAPASLGYNELGPSSEITRGVKWKRPRELCSKPQFIVGEATRTDICQGDLGDCWLMAAIASLTLNQDILARVIFPEQSFKKDYAGIFHFRLWQYGEWVDVIVDDKLPTRDGELLFVHSPERNEFWGALLEKAYAKVNGSYEALKGGRAGEGFEDFTGGIVESHKLSKAPENLFHVIMLALSRGSMLSTSITANVSETETVTTKQLVKRHAYSITGAEEVLVDRHPKQLVRLRNPWGHKEWNGAWSDESREWDRVLPEVKAKLNYCADDGEFWMAYSDFKEQYSIVEICHLIPDAPSHHDRSRWDLWQFEATFSSNWRFVVNLVSRGTNHASVLVGLMQKNVRKQKCIGRGFSNVGFTIYPVPEEVCTKAVNLLLILSCEPKATVQNAQPGFATQQTIFDGLKKEGGALDWSTGPFPHLEMIKQHKGRRSIWLSTEELSCMKAAFSSKLFPRREVCQRFSLPPGEYIIVPSTDEPNQKDTFLLRVFYER